MNRYAKVLLTVALAIAPPVAELATASNRTPRDLLQEHFDSQRQGVAMRVMNRRESVAVEICHDQCDIFRRSKGGGMPEEKFWELVLLFEYAKGVGTDYDAFRKSAAGTAVELVRSNSKFCRKQAAGAIDESPPCAWREWAASLRTRIGVSTYDEGQRCIGWRKGRSFSVWRYRCANVNESPWNSRR